MQLTMMWWRWLPMSLHCRHQQPNLRLPLGHPATTVAVRAFFMKDQSRCGMVEFTKKEPGPLRAKDGWPSTCPFHRKNAKTAGAKFVSMPSLSSSVGALRLPFVVGNAGTWHTQPILVCCRTGPSHMCRPH